MKRLIENYTFNSATKQVIIIDNENITQEKLLLITNMTAGIIIYNFADSDTRGLIAGNIITLNYDTISMSDTDKLQIWVEDTNPLMVTITTCISCIKNVVSKFTFDTLNQLRTTVAGTVAVSTLPTLSTVTTVGTVTTVSTGNISLGDMGKTATSILTTNQAFQITNGKNLVRS